MSVFDNIEINLSFSFRTAARADCTCARAARQGARRTRRSQTVGRTAKTRSVARVICVIFLVDFIMSRLPAFVLQDFNVAA